MNCLRDKIGIQWCGGQSSPAAGFFINSMAGVTIKMMEKLTTEEANTFIQVWNNIQDRAQRRLSMAVNREFSSRYQIRNLQRGYNLEKDIDTSNTTAAAAEYRGIFIDDNYFLQGEEVKLSALQSHWVQILNFYSPINQAGSIVKIFDYDLNTTLDTFTQDFTIGWNTIQVNSSYDAYKLFIGVDSTNFNSIDKILPTSANRFPVNVHGGSFAIASNISTMVKGRNTFGLSGVFSVKCKYDNIICNNIDLFSYPFAQLCASELMLECLASNRWNFITTAKKQAEEIKAHYDIEFEKDIKTTCEGISLDTDDICLECNETLQVRNSPFFAGTDNEHHLYN